MITSIRGNLVRALEDEVRLLVGAIEYQVLVPELVRRSIQTRLDAEVILHTIEFIEGNPTRGKLVPRLVGFLSEAELEFFNLFCTVDGVGVRTALKAMVRPVRDVADMIQRQDAKMLSTLPGISDSTAERVIAKLRKKVTKFALMVEQAVPAEDTTQPDVVEEAFRALKSVGHSDTDARQRIEEVIAGQKLKTVQDILQAIYQKR